MCDRNECFKFERPYLVAVLVVVSGVFGGGYECFEF